MLLAAFGGRDVASLGAGGIDEPAPDWPKSGQSPGGSTAAVLAARGGGGGGGLWWWWVVVVVSGKMGWSQCVTWVTFQTRLLDLATRGRLLIINGNYY